jgi:hypothetical protein
MVLRYASMSSRAWSEQLLRMAYFVLPRDLGHVEEPQVERVEDLVLHVVLMQRSAVGAGGHVVMGAGSVASTL